MTADYGFSADYLKALAKQLDAEARELQRQATAKQSAADACRKELRRRARERKKFAAGATMRLSPRPIL